MRFRNGVVYQKGKMFKDMVYIKVIRRNSSRTDGMVFFRYHNSGDSRIYSKRPQELKGFIVYGR